MENGGIHNSTIIFSLKVINVDSKTILNTSEKLGLTSSLYSITNDSGANAKKYPSLYSSLLKLSLGAKEVVNFLNEIGYIKSIYVFNGRTSSSYLISKYAHTNNVKILYYEYARQKILFETSLHHLIFFV